MPPARRGKRCKKAPAGGSDVESSIDVLPDGVLQHILGFLPARDAVRSCVLARRWQELWMFATGLRIIGNGDDDVEELREFVDHLLLLRGGAPLETCELRFEALTDAFSDGDVLRVNLWFRHAIRCQARVLRLVTTDQTNYFDLHDLHLISRHLVALELAGLEIKNSLLNLSGCPALQQLDIDDCNLSLAKKISSESLKRLSIKACVFSEISRTRIHAPSLVSLLLDDNWYNTPVLESMPVLVDSSIKIFSTNVDSCDICDSVGCNSCHGIIHGNCNSILLEGLSEAKNLELIAESKTFIFKMDLIRCPTFSKLKTLFLSDYWCVALDLDAITCILKHSPLLEKLTLKLFTKGSDYKMEMKGRYSPTQGTSGISEHLKIVEVKCEVVDERVIQSFETPVYIQHSVQFRVRQGRMGCQLGPLPSLGCSGTYGSKYGLARAFISRVPARGEELCLCGTDNINPCSSVDDLACALELEIILSDLVYHATMFLLRFRNGWILLKRLTAEVAGSVAMRRLALIQWAEAHSSDAAHGDGPWADGSRYELPRVSIF